MSTPKRDLTRIRHNTKIVATLGPGSNNVQLLEDMIRIGGLNVVRFNFSHGTAEFHQENARIVREASQRAGREVAIMADLQGPKIRVGKLEGGSIRLEAGEKLLLDAALEGEGNRERVGLDYRDLPNDVKAGDILLLDDGLLTLIVDSVNGSEILTTVQNSHVLKSNKGINKQGGGLSAGALTEKDFRDLKTAVGIGCDYLAVSFVKSAEDMKIARELVEQEMKGSDAVRPGLVAKIERVEAITNLDEIILASDGIMVARGDLAVEVGNAAVPALQKRMIRRARELRRFSITATQMMESMITNPVPTRAEVSDVANAVLDGTDAVMCSAETAVGAYPFETVRQMAIICAAAEAEQDSLNGVSEEHNEEAVSINLAIAGGAVNVARAVNAEAIVALTESGSTAFEISRHSIQLPIYALTPSVSAQRRMAMYRGVRPLRLATSTDHDTALDEVEAMLVERQVLSSGDKYIITSGSRMRETGSTNMLQVFVVH
ncbi:MULTISPECIES: pyruvate kinase [unclassified Neisseria]|uniref:pyruvate kinase n=1 Tax=unclassified Neisseria TaxID=2623750 RepID=UPI0026670424|nr:MULTISPECIES: pyruvate kinase [unclassified Neisseria]MDO1509721.1 pyruvate kinase [Neisseria sp. MVDL19-042950]MDO1515955.1 pyruvate kinase [Neisseria sp. MVDL18-041461]MDO1563068.1 pyruvate kinase [Neisseria sp. MVDL20-010259]